MHGIAVCYVNNGFSNCKETIIVVVTVLILAIANIHNLSFHCYYFSLPNFDRIVTVGFIQESLNSGIR